MENVFSKHHIPKENDKFLHESMAQNDTNDLCQRASLRNMDMSQPEFNLKPEMQVVDVRSIDAQSSYGFTWLPKQFSRPRATLGVVFEIRLAGG